jgi:hypothetical protein
VNGHPAASRASPPTHNEPRPLKILAVNTHEIGDPWDAKNAIRGLLDTYFNR